MKKTLSQILKQSFYEINENYMQVLTAYIVQIFLLFAAFLLLPPFGIILTFLVFVVTMIGMAKYNLQILNKKEPKIETVVTVNKNSISHIVTFIVKVFEVIFFSMFLIVPGIIRYLRYSQTPYILAQKEKLSTFETLTESRKLTQGALGKILLLKLIHIFIAVVLISFTASVIIITKVFIDISQQLTLIWLLLMSCSLITLIVLPFSAITNAILYENLKLTSKFNDGSQKNFFQEVAEDFITAFSRKPRKENQSQITPTKTTTTKARQNSKSTTTSKSTANKKTTNSQKSTKPKDKTM